MNAQNEPFEPEKSEDDAVDPSTVTKYEFLRAIFPDDLLGDGETGTFTTAKEAEDGGTMWPSRPMPKRKAKLPKATHFSPVSYKISGVNEFGNISRGVANALAAYGIGLDDINVKAQAMVGLDPSWIIETSPANYQYGYLLAEPCYDLQEYADLLYSLGQEGKTDQGATKVNQVFRLPNSQPYDKEHEAKLVVWAPENVYDIEDFWRAIDNRRYSRGVAVRDTDGVEALPEGTVIDCEFTEWVRAQDWYRGNTSRDGFETIICPWAHEHTTGGNTAGYNAPDHNIPVRGFSCLHDHCSGRKGKEFIAWAVEQGAPDVTVFYETEEMKQERLQRLAPRDLDALADVIGAGSETEPAEAVEPAEGEVIDPRDMFRGLFQDVTEWDGGALTTAGQGREISTADDTDAFVYFRNQLTIPDEVDFPDVIEIKRGVYAAIPTEVNFRYMMRVHGVSFDHNMITKANGFKLIGDGDLAAAAVNLTQPEVEIGSAIKDALYAYHPRLTRSAIQTIIDHMQPTPFNPAREWLLGLPEWDGKDWVTEICDNHLPSSNPEVTRLIMSRFFVGAVQVAMNTMRDSKKVEIVPILIGDQGTFKTTFVRTLVPERFTETGLAMGTALSSSDERDAVRKLTSCWIGEFGELATTMRTADIEALKNFFSRAFEKYRMPYAKDEIKVPRGTVWIATSDRQDVLHDPAGNRRFGAVFLTDKAVPLTDEQQVGLWSQALHMWNGGAPFHFTSEEEQVIAATVNTQASEDNPVATALELLYGDIDLSKPQDGWQWLTTANIAQMLREDHDVRMTDGAVRARLGRWMSKHKAKNERPRKNGKQIKSYLLPPTPAAARAASMVQGFDEVKDTDQSE